MTKISQKIRKTITAGLGAALISTLFVVAAVGPQIDRIQIVGAPPPLAVVPAREFEQPGASHEHGAGARRHEQPAWEAGIDLHVVQPALDRPQRERVDYRAGLEAVLDDEQPAELPQHAHARG